MKYLKIVIAMISFTISDGQIALPTIQAVHKPHNASNGTPENPLGDSGLIPSNINVGWDWMMGHTFTPQVNGSGGAYRRDNTHPIGNTYGNIVIECNVLQSSYDSDVMPNWSQPCRTDYWFGIPDITFITA